jgi:hypothetical protein
VLPTEGSTELVVIPTAQSELASESASTSASIEKPSAAFWSSIDEEASATMSTR